jgi:hypothetical protein
MIFITSRIAVEPDHISAIRSNEDYSAIEISLIGGQILGFSPDDTKLFTEEFISMLEAKLQLAPNTLPRPTQ